MKPIVPDSVEYLPIKEIRHELPRQAGGDPIHISTLTRWCRQGIGGVRLESVKVGGRRYVRREDVRRFLAAYAASDGTGAAVKD